MRIKYLEKSKGTLFNAIAHKTSDGIRCHTILINPLCRFIDNEADSQFLINATTDYSNKLELLKINESSNSDLVFEQDYIIFGVSQSDNNELQFIYSEEFDLSQEDLKEVHKDSIELAKILISTLSANEENIEKYLEEELSEMIEYNYTPLQEGVAEVFGVILTAGEYDNISLTVRYYSDPEHKKPNNNAILVNMLDKLVPIIANEFKTYNFFMLTEPVAIIKLGLSTSGEYMINTNDILLNNLEDNKLDDIKNLLSETYELL